MVRNMKKTYQKPEAIVVELKSRQTMLVITSGVTSPERIDWGGIDDGTLEPQ